MTPTLSVGFSAAADGRQVTIDQDCVLISAHSSNTNAIFVALISRDPAATIANTIGTPADGVSESILAICSRAGSSVDSGIPLSGGSRLFVSANSACQIVLLFSLTTP